MSASAWIAVLTAVLAWIVFKEHADRRIILGMLLIVAGGMVLSQHHPLLPRAHHLVSVAYAEFHCLKHSIAAHLLDASADLAFVKDWLGHVNIQNTTIWARLTTATLDAQAGTIFASHQMV